MEDKYNLKNACETRMPWPKSMTKRSFLFVDGKFRESSRFFKKHGVKTLYVWQEKEYIPNPNYHVLFCEISKKDEEVEKVIEALHDLEVSMPLLGYKDYEEVCDEFMNALLKECG